jgi:hypothetical protein
MTRNIVCSFQITKCKVEIINRIDFKRHMAIIIKQKWVELVQVLEVERQGVEILGVKNHILGTLVINERINLKWIKKKVLLTKKKN